MASARAESPARKLQRAIASPCSPLRGALLILNVLLYAICPVSAVAALPRDHFRSPPYSNSTTNYLPKWHNGSIANASLSTWGNTFASGPPLATGLLVDTTQGRPYISPSRGFRFASHSPHNFTALPWSANATHLRGSTTSMSSSPSRCFKSVDTTQGRPYISPSRGFRFASHSPHNFTALPWSANATHLRGSTTSMSSSPSRCFKSVDTTQGRSYTSPSRGLHFASHSPHNITNLPWSANATHRQGSTTSMSSSPSRYLKFGGQKAPTTHDSTNIASLSSKRSRSPGLAHHQSSPSHQSASDPSRSSFASRSTTRAHSGTASTDVSLAIASSIPSGSLSSQPPSSSSRSKSFTTPHHTSNSPHLSGRSSSSSKTTLTSHPARSPTSPSQSSSASITPRSSTTPTSSVTSDPSSSSNTLPFSLPPGCTITTVGNETYVLIPTERARKPYKQYTPSSSLSPSATAQAGAAGYNHGGGQPPDKPESFPDKVVDNDSPSTRSAAIALGVVLGVMPHMISVPIMWLRWREWRVKKYVGESDAEPKSAAEECQVMYEAVKQGKWTKRLSLWFKDFNEFCNFAPDKLATVDPPNPKRAAKLKAKAEKLKALEGPRFNDEVRRLEDPFERDPGACNYANPAESEGCVDPPEHWPRPAGSEDGPPVASEGGPERLTHEQSMALAEQLPLPRDDLQAMGGVTQKILEVPEGYERLTLDGKIAYFRQCNIRNFNIADPRIRYKDGRCAAVGPGNSPLGGQDVDKIWIDEEKNLIVGGAPVNPNSEIGLEFRMMKYEEARFVRQNFPLSHFKEWRAGSQFSPDPLSDPGANEEDDGGKGKDKASDKTSDDKGSDDKGSDDKGSKVSWQNIEDGLTWSEKQAIEMQIDHDLLQVSDQIIQDWWDKKTYNQGPSQSPSMEYLRKIYWGQNHGKGPGPGDFEAWASQPPPPLPPSVESSGHAPPPPPPSVEGSNSDSEQTGDTTIHHDVGPTNPEDAAAEQIREQMREADEAMRELQRDREQEAQWLEDEAIRELTKDRAQEARWTAEQKARDAIREQIRKADLEMKKEGETRQQEAKKMEEEAAEEELKEELRKAEKKLSKEARARIERMKEWIEEQAKDGSSQGSKNGKGKDGNGRGGNGRGGGGQQGGDSTIHWG